MPLPDVRRNLRYLRSRFPPEILLFAAARSVSLQWFKGAVRVATERNGSVRLWVARLRWAKKLGSREQGVEARSYVPGSDPERLLPAICPE